MATHYPVNEPSRPYADRYKRDAHSIMDRIYGAGPYIVGLLGFFVALTCLVILDIFDPVVGTFSASYMTGGSKYMDWFTSGATTGLILAIFGTAIYGWRERWPWWIIGGLIVVGLIPASIDVYFDAMAVDILRFGHFIIPSQQFAGNPADIWPHNLYRIMFGALSAVGEPLTAGSVIIFPVIRELLKGVLSS
jgi:hypothetical protein